MPCSSKESESSLQLPVITQRILSGSSVTFVGIEHDAPEGSYPWKTLTQVSQSKSGIVLEYFPWELEKTVYNDPVLGRIARSRGDETGINRFFGTFSEITHNLNKKILVMDPADKLNFLYYCNLPFISSFLATGADAMLIAEKKDLLRRDFLILAGLIGISLLTFQWCIGDLFGRSFLNTNDMREAFVAHGLRQSCQKPNTDLAVIYPQKHIEGVIRHFDNPQLVHDVAPVYNLPLNTRSIREYQPANNGWNLVNNTPISLG
jgi:hypothetical protein